MPEPDPRVEAAAEAIYDAKFVAPRREPRYETLMVQCRVEAAAALRAADAVKPPCETCKGKGKVRNPAELGPGMHINTVSNVTCPTCGGSGEAPSP